MPKRLLVRNATIVTVDESLGTIDGDVLIVDGFIDAVGPDAGVGIDDAEIIDARGKIAMPGLIDTHRHTWQSCLRHRNGDNYGPDYFAELLWKIGPSFTPDDVYIGTLLGAVSALDSGTTTLFDWSHIQNSPEHSDAAVAALRDSGIRAVFGYGWPLTDADAWMRESALPHPDDLRRIQSEHFSEPGLLSLAMSARGPEMTDDRVWRQDLALARELGIMSSIHVGIAGFGPIFRAVERMQAAGALGDDLIFIHMNSCSDDEIRYIAESGAHACLGVQVECVSQGSGEIPTDRLLAAGLWPSLSGDTETIGSGDMFTQMRQVLSEYRLKAGTGRAAPGAPETLTIPDTLRMGTLIGAETLGLGDVTGSIAPGKRADLVLLDAEALNLAPVSDPEGAIVLAAHPGNVDTVIVDGRVVKQNGELVGVDVERILDLARRSNARHVPAHI